VVASVLAIVAASAISRGRSWATAAVWLFNVWGTADLLFGLYQGPHFEILPGAFGAAF
jgi:hypothetical protein